MAIYCRKDHYDITDPTTLPVAQYGDPLEYKSSPQSAPIPCDLCKGGTDAAVFCMEIQKKLCQQHKEVSLPYIISQN